MLSPSASLNGREDQVPAKLRGQVQPLYQTLRGLREVAEINGKAAKRIDRKYLSRLITGLEDQNPEELGILEIAYETGHR